MNLHVDMGVRSSVGDPLIVCDRVSHTYGSTLGEETTALDGVALSIDAGEFVCVVGPSGCGKTTILNMIAGFITPTAGRITIDATPITEPSPDRGIVFQDYSLFPWLTVRANVEFGLFMAHRPARERHAVADALLAMVGLDGIGTKYPFELSGGMKQRVAIARALATRPRVLLMDEPFAALDAMTRHALQEQILAIHRRDAQTVVFVTHNIGEAVFLGSRVIVMAARPGRVIEDIRIDLPRPRRRTTPAFNELYDRIARSIGLETVE